MMVNIIYPTENHKRFINYIADQCVKKSISCLIKGSLAKGSAKEYSDVDIVLTGVLSDDVFDDIIGAFDNVLLSERMITNTFMVIYSCGLAVEYDVRRSVTKEDLAKSISVCIGECPISDVPRDRIILNPRLCPLREPTYSKVMIVQMCCAKLLCQKEEQAKDIYCDRMELLYGKSDFISKLKKEIYSERLDRFIARLKNQISESNLASESIQLYFNKIFLFLENFINY